MGLYGHVSVVSTFVVGCYSLYQSIFDRGLSRWQFTRCAPASLDIRLYSMCSSPTRILGLTHSKGGEFLMHEDTTAQVVVPA